MDIFLNLSAVSAVRVIGESDIMREFLSTEVEDTEPERVSYIGHLSASLHSHSHIEIVLS